MRNLPLDVISGLLVLGFIAIDQSHAAMAADKRKPDIRGSITSVSITDQTKNLGHMRVEGKVESDTGFDKAMIRILAVTKLEKIEKVDVLLSLKEEDSRLSTQCCHLCRHGFLLH